MKSLILPAIIVLALVSVYLFGSIKAPSPEPAKAPPGLQNSSENLLATVANLNSATAEITPGPVHDELEGIDRSVPCAPFPGFGTKNESKIGRDHQHAFAPGQQVLIRVFVSNNTRNALANNPTKFPVDTVILKQKLLREKDVQNVLLYTGMLKREAGFNPECGDWEFFTVSGDGKNLTSRGKLANCMECHKEYPKSDFVTKVNYIIDPSKKP